LILAGDTTFGTQAAVEYVCRERLGHGIADTTEVSKPSELEAF